VIRTPFTAAITGATGFIGRHVAADLVARGIAVKAVVRPGSRHQAPPGTTVVHAPLDAAALREAFAGADVVIHLAGVVAAVDARTFAAVNVDGTRAVATAARDAGSRLVHVSSVAAAGPATASAPHREDDEPHPVTPYGSSKLAGEQTVKATSGLRWLILRPGVVYGPTDRAVLPLFQAAQRGLLPLVGRPGAAYTFIYVDDVVRTIVSAVGKADATGTVFVGHPAPVSSRDVLDAIQAAIGRRARVVPVPLALTYVAALAADVTGRILRTPMPLNLWRYAELAAEGFVCRVDRMRDELGVTASVSLGDGMARTAAWYREAGWL
jgi:nucleoside-diphosphate-sugar epimerase